MGNMVVAFIFPEPANPIQAGIIVANAKKTFADMPEVKVYMSVREAAETIEFFLTTGKLPIKKLEE